MSISNARTYED
jgi:5-methylcytosine-specific restriction endonuclease McrA